MVYFERTFQKNSKFYNEIQQKTLVEKQERGG
jgi:hypothetical protein